MYKTPKLIYEGTVINYLVAFGDVLKVTDNSTIFKLKPLTLEINTGEELTQVTAMQLAKESSIGIAAIAGSGRPMQKRQRLALQLYVIYLLR